MWKQILTMVTSDEVIIVEKATKEEDLYSVLFVKDDFSVSGSREDIKKEIEEYLEFM